MMQDENMGANQVHNSVMGMHAVPHTSRFGGADNDEFDLAEYWKIIKGNIWSIIGLTVLAGLVGGLTAFSASPVYKAEVKLLVEPDAPKIVSLDPLQAASNIMFFYETQYEIIGSRSVTEAVIKKLALDKNPDFIADYGNSKFSFDKLVKLLPAEWQNVDFTGGLFSGDRPVLTTEEYQEELTTYFQKHLSIGGEDKSQIVIVSYEAPTAQLAADIANAVVAAYVERNLDSKLFVVKQATSWLTDRLGDLRQKLVDSESALLEFQTREGVVDTKNSQEIIRGKLSKITQELVGAQINLAEAESRYNQLLVAQRNKKEVDSLRSVLQNQLVQKLKEEESKLGRHVAELSERYGEKHPKMIAAKSDLNEAMRRLKSEVGKVVEGIRREYEVAAENERKLRSIYEKQEAEIRQLKGKGFQLAKMERDVEANRNLYEMFLTRFKETNMTEDSKVTNIQVIDSARRPTKPFKPKKKLIIIGSMFAGLLLGFFLALLKDRLDNTFKGHEDIERKLALPVLGMSPLIGNKDLKKTLSGEGSISMSGQMFIEAINNIRTSTLFSNIDTPPKTFLVTSSVPNEGKTTLSCELAMSFSQLGPTLLLEADLRNPSVAKTMGLDERIGITEFVSGQATAEEVIRKHHKRNLSFITCGAIPPNPLEFVSSKKFKRALDDLKTRFEYIIIDTPPVFLFSDVLVLGQLVDALIMVVRVDWCKHNVAQGTLKRLHNSHIKPLGVVLSHANTKSINGYGDYYYGKYYGAGAKAGNSAGA